jgi:hypothetical protein
MGVVFPIGLRILSFFSGLTWRRIGSMPGFDNEMQKSIRGKGKVGVQDLYGGDPTLYLWK